MGVDLAILPVTYNINGYCDDVLNFRPSEHSEGLYDRIRELQSHFCHAAFPTLCHRMISEHDPERECDRMKDEYGEDLKFVSAWDLCKLPIPAHIKAYLSRLPHNTKVILYWH